MAEINPPPSVILSPVAPVNPPPPVVTTQNFRYAPLSLEFEYSKQFVFTSPAYAGLTDAVTQLELSKDAYPNTNFSDAGFAISSTFSKTLKDCLATSVPQNGDGFKSSKMINNFTVYYTASGGAAAGNLYESRVYRTLRGNTCIEFTETIHTTNIGNYDPGTVTEINKEPIWETLEGILTTVKFYK